MNYRGILKFDWQRVGLLPGGGLHYDKESFGGELCTWMNNDMATNVETFSFEGGSLEVKFLGQPQSLGQETWPLGELQLE